MNRINPVSLVGWIVHSCQLYSKNEQTTHNVRDFVHKSENIIIHMLEISFVNSSSYYIKVNLEVLYGWASD